MRKTLALLLTAAFIVVFFGYCVRFKYEFFEYEVGEHNFSWGLTYCCLWSTPNYTENYDGSPYELSINVDYYWYNKRKITSALVSDVSVFVGDNSSCFWQSDQEYSLNSDLSKRRTRIEGKDVYVYNFSAKIVSIELPYEPVTVRAKLHLKSDEEVIEEVIEYKMETAYRVVKENFLMACTTN